MKSRFSDPHQKVSIYRALILDASIFAYLISAITVWAFDMDRSSLLLLGRNASFFAFFWVISFGVCWFVIRGGQQTLGFLIFNLKSGLAKRAGGGRFWRYEMWAFLFVTFVAGIIVTRFSFADLSDSEGLHGAGRIFYDLGHPNFEILPRAVVNIIETFFMAFIATILALPIAFVMCFFCAKNIMKSPWAFPIYVFLRGVLNVTRSIEALIWAIIFSVWVGIGPFAGTLALMIHSIASLAQQYSEIVETVNEGPIEGILSTGANQIQVIWFAVVPQVVLPFISFTVYRWDINIRMATIIGLVGGGGIGTLLIQYQGQAMWHEVGTILLVIAIVVWIMDTASAQIREALK